MTQGSDQFSRPEERSVHPSYDNRLAAVPDEVGVSVGEADDRGDGVVNSSEDGGHALGSRRRRGEEGELARALGGSVHKVNRGYVADDEALTEPAPRLGSRSPSPRR